MVAHRVFEDGTGAGAVGHFARHGWVHVRPDDGDASARRLQAWADEVAAWPDRRIDYIFNGFHGRDGPGRPVACRVVADEATDGVWPSDHFGVLALLRDGDGYPRKADV